MSKHLTHTVTFEYSFTYKCVDYQKGDQLDVTEYAANLLRVAGHTVAKKEEPKAREAGNG